METKKVFAVMKDESNGNNIITTDYDCDILGIFSTREKAWDCIMKDKEKEERSGNISHSNGFEEIGSWGIEFEDGRKICYTLFDDMEIE